VQRKRKSVDQQLTSEEEHRAEVYQMSEVDEQERKEQAKNLDMKVNENEAFCK
jgi:hypothetical protein